MKESSVLKKSIMFLKILLTILLIHLGAPISWASEEEKDPLGIEQLIIRNEVVVLGWHHFPAPNDVVPRLLGEKLEFLAKHDTAILIERSSDQSAEELVAEFRSSAAMNRESSLFDSLRSEATVLLNANSMGIPLLGGDLPGRNREMSERDRSFANHAAKLVSGGRRVLIWVGDAHVEGILELLSEMGVTADGIRTSWDETSHEVRAHDRLLGVTRGLSFEEMYPAVKSDQDSRTKPAQGILRALWQKCSVFLSE